MSHRNRLPVIQDAPGEAEGAGTSRRDFLRNAAAGAVLAAVAGCKPEAVVEELQRRHLSELSPQRLQEMLSKLEKKWSAQFGKPVTVGARPPFRAWTSPTASTSRAASAAAAASTPA